MDLKFNLIVALCKNNGIGINNRLPWSIKEDMAFFSKTTIGQKNNAVIMGRKTWESLPKKYQQTGLPFRDNFILSSSLSLDTLIDNTKENQENQNNNIIKSFENIDNLINYLNNINKNYDELWVIGGSEIYNSFLKRDLINKCVISFIDKKYECDAFFPQLDKIFKVTNMFNLIENNSYDFNIYIKEYTKN
jgi:dihydrofolate reductase